jgi:hypothetical protein
MRWVVDAHILCHRDLLLARFASLICSALVPSMMATNEPVLWGTTMNPTLRTVVLHAAHSVVLGSASIRSGSISLLHLQHKTLEHVDMHIS